MTDDLPGPHGPLASVLAVRSRTGILEHREALVYTLGKAAELEHLVMLQYLFAAFSLKQDVREGVTPEQLVAIQRWRKTLLEISAQEMLHLALVQNLLTAVGAAPRLARPNFPMPAYAYPAGVRIELLPFGEAALRHFAFLERPEGMDVADARSVTATSSGQRKCCSVAWALGGPMNRRSGPSRPSRYCRPARIERYSSPIVSNSWRWGTISSSSSCGSATAWAIASNPSASSTAMPSGRSRKAKWRRAASPNGTSSIRTPAGKA